MSHQKVDTHRGINPLTTTSNWWPKEFSTICDTTTASFVLKFFPLSWWSINLLICVKKFQVILLSLCHVTYKWCNFQQMKLSIRMTSFLTFRTCLIMLCLLVYFLDHSWMTSILFDVNMYCGFFFYIQSSKLGHQWPSGT